MLSEPLDERKDIRLVTTSPVRRIFDTGEKEIAFAGDFKAKVSTMTIHTRNSIYHLAFREVEVVVMNGDHLDNTAFSHYEKEK